MGCKKRVVSFAKWGARFLGPVLGAHIPSVVALLEQVSAAVPDLVLSGHQKRAIVIESVKARAKEIGHDVYDDAKTATVAELERVTRAAIESALHELRSGADLNELQDWADAETPVTV